MESEQLTKYWSFKVLLRDLKLNLKIKTINQDQFVYSIIDGNLDGTQYILRFKALLDCKNNEIMLYHLHR